MSTAQPASAAAGVRRSVKSGIPERYLCMRNRTITSMGRVPLLLGRQVLVKLTFEGLPGPR